MLISACAFYESRLVFSKAKQGIDLHAPKKRI